MDRMVEVRSFNLTDDMDSWSLSTNPFVGHSSWLALILLFSGSLRSEVKKNMTHIFRTNFEFIFFIHVYLPRYSFGIGIGIGRYIGLTDKENALLVSVSQSKVKIIVIADHFRSDHDHDRF